MNKILKLLIFTFLLISASVNAQVNIRHFMSMGENALRNSNYQDALKNFNVVITFKPDLFEPYFLRGIAKFNLGDFIGADRDFSKSIDMHPLYSHAYHYRAITRDQMKNYHKGILDFNKALEIDPFNADIYVSRGATRIHMKSYISAVQDLDMAIKYDANNPLAYLNRAVAKNLLKQNEEAIKDCNKAIQLDYFNTGAYLKRGLIKMEIEKYDSALIDFEQAIKLDPSDPYAYFNRAMVKVYLNDSIGALNDYNKVIGMDPYNALTFYNRALLKTNLKDYDGALEDYTNVILINPDNVYTYYNRGYIKHELKDYKGAIKDYNKALELFPDFAGAYINRSAARANIGDHQGAKEDNAKAMSIINALHGEDAYTDALMRRYADSAYFQKIIQFEADFKGQVDESSIAKMDKSIIPEPFFVVLLVTDDQEYLDQARSEHYFLKILEVPISRRITSTFGLTNEILSLDHSQIDRQTRIADSLLIYNPYSKEAYFYKGVINGSLQNYKDALDAYTKAIEIDPKFALAYLNRSIVYYEIDMNNYTEETMGQEITISWGKNDPQYVIKESKIPEFKKSLKDINRAIELDPELAVAYFNRANIKLALKDYTGAIADFSIAIEKEPELGEAYFNRGLTCLYLKDTRKACNDLGKAGEFGVTEAYKAINRYCYKY